MNVYDDLDKLPYDESGFPLLFSSRYLKYQRSEGLFVYVIGDAAGNYIPITVHKKYGFKRGKFLYTPWNANHLLNEEAEKKFLEELRKFLQKKSLTDVVYPPIHICSFHSIPSFGLAAKMGVIKVMLYPKSEEEIFSGFQAQYRNIIRKAEKDGVEIFFGRDYIEDFYSLYRDTILREKSIPNSESTIRHLADHLGPDSIQCGVAYFNKKPQAALFNVYNRFEAYNLYAGTASPSLHKGALKLLHWNAIIQLLKQKVQSYCLGGIRPGITEGSKYERIVEFKMRFGAVVDNGFHFILPITAKYKLYTFLLKSYSQLRGLHLEEENLPYTKIETE